MSKFAIEGEPDFTIKTTFLTWLIGCLMVFFVGVTYFMLIAIINILLGGSTSEEILGDNTFVDLGFYTVVLLTIWVYYRAVKARRPVKSQPAVCYVTPYVNCPYGHTHTLDDYVIQNLGNDIISLTCPTCSNTFQTTYQALQELATRKAQRQEVESHNTKSDL